MNVISCSPALGSCSDPCPATRDPPSTQVLHPKPVASSGRRDDTIPRKVAGRHRGAGEARGASRVILGSGHRSCPLPAPLLVTGGLQQQRGARLGTLSPHSGHPPQLPQGALRTHFPESSWSSGPWPPCCSWLEGSAERRARFHAGEQSGLDGGSELTPRNLGQKPQHSFSHKPQGCVWVTA